MKKTFKHSKFTATFTDEKGYFSFTGNIDGSSGAVGDEIAKVYPDFKLMADTHLADCKTGKPMHAWQNAEYWSEKGEIETLAKHLRTDIINASLYPILLNSHLSNPDSEFDSKNLANYQSDLEEEWLNQVDEVYTLVNETPSNLTSEFMNPLDENGEPLPEYEEILSTFDDPEKAIAAATIEDIDVSDVSENYGTYSAGGNEYMILTDDEANEKWDDSLENYIDECLEIPKSMINYFDRDAWKRDAHMDGRGHSLSSYDGEENEEKVNGTVYFLYRQ